MAEVDGLIKRGWQVVEISATLKREVEDDGETLERTRRVTLDEQDLHELAKSDAKDDKATIRDLRAALKDMRDKRKAAKDRLAALKARRQGPR
jgi:hypothetical protein